MKFREFVDKYGEGAPAVVLGFMIILSAGLAQIISFAADRNTGWPTNGGSGVVDYPKKSDKTIINFSTSTPKSPFTSVKCLTFALTWDSAGDILRIDSDGDIFLRKKWIGFDKRLGKIIQGKF